MQFKVHHRSLQARDLGKSLGHVPLPNTLVKQLSPIEERSGKYENLLYASFSESLYSTYDIVHCELTNLPHFGIIS